jgi:putative ABC transport system permease protein
MLKHYFLTALRAASRQKTHTAINLIGLIIGISTSTLIYLWVLNETSYDRFHANANSLYRIEQDQSTSSGLFHVNITSEPLGQAAQVEIPEILNATRFGFLGEVLLRHDEKVLYEGQTRYVDSSFLSMFSFPLLEGDSAQALANPSSAVISRSLANRLFGRDQGVLGESLVLNNEHQLFVTGVAEDVPSTSLASFNLLVPASFAVAAGFAGESWTSNNVRTYVQLAPGAVPVDAAEKISALHFTHTTNGQSIADLPATGRGTPAWRAAFMLRPVPDVYLTGYFGYGKPTGRIQNLYILSGIGLMVLLIACINFVNLTVSRAARRGREVGLRKTVGAVRSQLACQYFGETVGLLALAASLALLLVHQILPSFNAWSGKQLSLNLIGDSTLLLGILAIVLVTGLAAGIYPALILSSFRPRAFLGGHVPVTPLGQAVRRFTVALQFVISAILLVGTAVAHRQVDYLNSRSLGYNPENLVTLQLRGNMVGRYESFRQRLAENANSVVSVTGSWQHPAYNSANTVGIEWPGKGPDDNIPIGVNFVDFEYLETMGIGMLEGRTLDRHNPGDSINNCIINEEFASMITDVPALGAPIKANGQIYTVVGITKSFHRTSLLETIEPTMLRVNPGAVQYVTICLSDPNWTEGLAAVERIFAEVYSDYPFDYATYNAMLDDMYGSQEQLAGVLQVSGVVAIVIACLGMFGLASFSAERRLKEMAVRKVLGASSGRLFGLLAKEYLIVVTLANLVAAPITFYLVQGWLDDFPYRIGIDPLLFVLAALCTVVVALAAVGSQSIKAVTNSPSVVLKIE